MIRLPRSLGRQLLLAGCVLSAIAILAGWIILERSIKLTASAVADTRLSELLDELRGVRATFEITGQWPLVAGDLELLWQISADDGTGTRSELLEQNSVRLAPQSEMFSQTDTRLGALRVASRQVREMVPAPPATPERTYRQVTYWAAMTDERRAMLLESIQAPLRRAGTQLLFGFAAILITALALIAVLVNRPISRLNRQAMAFARGDREKLEGHYPQELQLAVDHLNRASQRQQRSAEQSRRYINKIAHDLKTPIAVIESALCDPMQPALARQRLDAMRDAIARYSALATAVGPGSPQPERALLEPLRSAIDGFSLLYRPAPWQIVLDADQGLRARIAIEDVDTIVSNLLSNAHKHARSRAILSARRQGCTLILSCQDDGPGLSADQFERALGWGIRLDERPAGSGLGLAILCDFATLYDGAVRQIESALGGLGIEIELRLPNP